MPRARYPAFIELRSFRRRWESFDLTDRDLRRLQLELGQRPNAGQAVPGAGGIRKLRFAPETEGKGKSGGYRVYYANLTGAGVIVLAVLFRKNEAADISQRQRQGLMQAVQVIESQMRQQEEERDADES